MKSDIKCFHFEIFNFQQVVFTTAFNTNWVNVECHDISYRFHYFRKTTVTDFIAKNYLLNSYVLIILLLGKYNMLINTYTIKYGIY